MTLESKAARQRPGAFMESNEVGLRVLLLRRLSCLAAVLLSQAAPAYAQQATPRELNVMIAQEGSISLKRAGWTKAIPAFFGTTIMSGDQLYADSKTARAVIACADLSVRNVTDFPSGLPCETKGPLLTYKDSRLAPARSGGTSSISVISPRSTAILEGHPKIRWTSTAPMSAYRVTVRGQDLKWWIDVSGKTELVYPRGAPALTAGVDYKVTVTAGGRSSDEDKSSNLGFSVLSSSQADAVRRSEAKLRSLDLSNDAALLLLATLYAGNELHGAAIDLLEPVRATKEPALLFRLADLLLRVQRIDDVAAIYRQAADIAVARGDLETEAIANERLGNVYALAQGDTGKALTCIERATAIYQSLGDEKRLDQLKARRLLIENK